MGKPMRKNPAELSIRTQVALLELKKALAFEGDIRAAQVTFDEVECHDYPPVVDIKWIPKDQDG